MSSSCPQCGWSRVDGAHCPRCGVDVARYRADLAAVSALPAPAVEPAAVEPEPAPEWAARIDEIVAAADQAAVDTRAQAEQRAEDRIAEAQRAADHRVAAAEEEAREILAEAGRDSDTHRARAAEETDHLRAAIDERAREAAERGAIPGGTERNAASVADAVSFAAAVDRTTRLLLADAQTSGGLLIAVAAERADTLVAALRREATPAADVIGRVVTGKPGTIAVV